MSAANSLVAVEGLAKHFFVGAGDVVRAVDDVSFTIGRGETLGLVGESGCGKSTVGRLIARLLTPTEGRVLFEGEDLAKLDGEALRRRRVDFQMVFQDPFGSLNPRKRVIDMIREPLDIHGRGTRAERRARAFALLERVGLGAHQAERYPHEFSGGQRQRIGIARALSLNPKLLICDEAVSALDVSIQAQVVNLLRDLQREMALTYLFIAHDLSVVRHISDRVVVMYLGKIVEIADRKALFSTPRHPYTQALLSAIPRPQPGRRRERVILQGDIPSPLSPPSGCRFHTRCPLAFDRCRVEEPPLIEIAGKHQAACHLAQPGGDGARLAARESAA